MSKDQCQGFYSPRYGGARCPHAGKHRHETQGGAVLRLCGKHRNVLLKREHLGSDEEKVGGWLAGRAAL